MLCKKPESKRFSKKLHKSLEYELFSIFVYNVKNLMEVFTLYEFITRQGKLIQIYCNCKIAHLIIMMGNLSNAVTFEIKYNTWNEQYKIQFCLKAYFINLTREKLVTHWYRYMCTGIFFKFQNQNICAKSQIIFQPPHTKFRTPHPLQANVQFYRLRTSSDLATGSDYF